MRRTLIAVFAALLLSAVGWAQPQTGTYAHGAFDAKTLDTINIGNLNVYFSLPVYSKPGRGLPLYYNLAYNSSVWARLPQFPGALPGRRFSTGVGRLKRMLKLGMSMRTISSPLVFPAVTTSRTKWIAILNITIRLALFTISTELRSVTTRLAPVVYRRCGLLLLTTHRAIP